MNWIDLILIVILLLAIRNGWQRGFIRGSLDLFTWLGSLVAGFLLYPYTAGSFKSIGAAGAWLLPAAFILTCIGARILLGFIIKRISNIIPEKINHDIINKFLGIIPGAINGLIFATIIAALLLAIPLKKSITKETQSSHIAMTLSSRAKWANKKLAPVFDEAVRETMQSFTLKHGTHEKTGLNFTCNNPAISPSLEEKMLELINHERAKEGLQPLKADLQERTVARAHSKDMFARGYFAHENLEGKDPFDRMKDAHIQFKTAGENLALAQTLEIAHRNLMNSPGHRANIMNPAFNRVGIGIMDGGFYGLMISQEFRN
jgi:uncharacterized protein YkwD